MKKLFPVVLAILMILALGSTALAYDIPVDSVDALRECYGYTLDGVSYELPTPVAQLAENGWTLDVRGQEKLEAMTYTIHADLVKGDISIPVYVLNATDADLPVADCAIAEISVNDSSVPFALANGVHLGMTAGEVLNAFGMTYEYRSESFQGAKYSDPDGNYNLDSGYYLFKDGKFIYSNSEAADCLGLEYGFAAGETFFRDNNAASGDNSLSIWFDADMLSEVAKANSIRINLMLPTR